mmetsp:Transcript_12264/g.17634  ORF Transcript_12264/g.17634 Transcript_12264/m.17634 type:complete len:109 (+) Transcript_12264:493-819(+)
MKNTQAGSVMSKTSGKSGIGGLIYISGALALGMYFTFGAVQGDFGLFQRVQIEAEKQQLIRERDVLEVQLASTENKTCRLSDDYLDLDLLDQQARDVLGVMRPNEIII